MQLPEVSKKWEKEWKGGKEWGKEKYIWRIQANVVVVSFLSRG